VGLAAQAIAAPARLIAIVDDEDKVRQALGRLLRAHGYRVLGFGRGEELMQAIGSSGSEPIDCVLLDLFMPGMSGFDVLAALQGSAAAPPVIVVSAHDEVDMRERAIALNACSVQRKPISAAALLAAIERAVAARSGA
jgi:FixJ family two-component response regulator